jgi:hypothetical protein
MQADAERCLDQPIGQSIPPDGLSSATLRDATKREVGGRKSATLDDDPLYDSRGSSRVRAAEGFAVVVGEERAGASAGALLLSPDGLTGCGGDTPVLRAHATCAHAMVEGEEKREEGEEQHLTSG